MELAADYQRIDRLTPSVPTTGANSPWHQQSGTRPPNGVVLNGPCLVAMCLGMLLLDHRASTSRKRQCGKRRYTAIKLNEKRWGQRCLSAPTELISDGEERFGPELLVCVVERLLFRSPVVVILRQIRTRREGLAERLDDDLLNIEAVLGQGACHAAVIDVDPFIRPHQIGEQFFVENAPVVDGDHRRFEAGECCVVSHVHYLV